jgi:PAS domain S-box-containing protein
MTGIVEHRYIVKNLNVINMAVFSILLTAGLTRRISVIKEIRLKAENLEKQVKERTDALQYSETKYKNLIEQLNDIVWQIDKAGLFTFCSSASVNILGISAENFIGKHFSHFFPKRQASIIDEALKKTTNSPNGFTSLEFFTYKTGGQKIILETSGKPIYDSLNKLIGYHGIARDITEKKNFQKQLLSAIIETEDRERTRFAADLHDGLGATLSGINMYINTINSEGLDETLKKELLNKISRLVKNAAVEAREIANNIRPNEIAFLGLRKSIETLCSEIQFSGKHKIHTDFEKFKHNYDQETELVLFRIVSEMINNTVKHSGAQNIEIKFISTDNALILKYSDDGVGFEFDSMKINSTTGMGLGNIIARVKTLNATLNIDTKPGKGVQFTIVIPDVVTQQNIDIE